MQKSGMIAISSVIRVFLGFILSTALISVFYKDKIYGQILGQIIAGLVICFFWICYIKPYFKIKFLAIHLKYILRYCLPLIPYALSGVILEQFGKFAISNQQSLSQAGFYTLALTISSIVSIVISVTHQAWNPYYFEYMNSKNYDKLDSEFIRILKITIIVAFGVAAFGIDIGILLAKNTFTGYLHLIPIFTIGHVYEQVFVCIMCIHIERVNRNHV